MNAHPCQAHKYSLNSKRLTSFFTNSSFKRFVVLAFLFIFTCKVSLQAKELSIDSLQTILKTDCQDTVKLNVFQKILDVCDMKDNLKFSQQAVSFADKLLSETIDRQKRLEILKHKADYLVYAVYYYNQEDKNKQKALDYSFLSLKASLESEDFERIGKAYGSIGNQYHVMENYPEVLLE